MCDVLDRTHHFWWESRTLVLDGLVSANFYNTVNVYNIKFSFQEFGFLFGGLTIWPPLLFNLWKICSWLQAVLMRWWLASPWTNWDLRGEHPLHHPLGLGSSHYSNTNCWDHSVFWTISGLNMWGKIRRGKKKIKMGWVTEKGKDERREYQLMGQSQLSLSIYPNVHDYVIFCLKMMALPIKIFTHSFLKKKKTLKTDFS